MQPWQRWQNWVGPTLFLSAATHLLIRMFQEERPNPIMWAVLVLGALVSVAVYFGPRTVGAWCVNMAQRIGHKLAPHAHRLGVWSQGNVAAAIAWFFGALAVISFLVAVGYNSRPSAERGFIFALISGGFAAAHVNGPMHFWVKRNEYWLGLSLFGAAYTFAFDHKGTGMFLISALLATITLFGLWKKTFEVLGEMFFGGFNYYVTLGSWGVAFVIAGVLLQHNKDKGLPMMMFALASACGVGLVALGGKWFVEHRKQGEAARRAQIQAARRARRQARRQNRAQAGGNP